MRYMGFKISNFRGIKHLEVVLDRDPQTNVYTLVGLNESGKSTILHALHWLREPNTYDFHDLIPKSLRANFNGAISVEASVSLSEADEEEITAELKRCGLVLEQKIGHFKLERKFTYKDSARTLAQWLWTIQPVVHKQKGKKSYRLMAGTTEWQSLIKYIEEKMLPPIIYYENFLFDIPDRIYLERASRDLTSQDQLYRQVVQDVLTSLRMNLNIDNHLLERHRSGKRADLDNVQAVLDDASAQLTDVVISAWREIVKNTDQKLEVSLGRGVEEDQSGLFLQMKVREGKQTFYIRERSLGFRWFFGFILFTHFRTYRDNSRRNALFLLDEPASNLHPAAQTKLLSAFSTLPNNQIVIYSTHSHHMIRPDWLAGAYVVRNTGHDYSGLDLNYNAFLTDVQAERYFQFVAHHPQETDLYRPILDALEYRPGPLEKVPELIVVEGKNDYYTLRYMVEVLKLGGNGEYHFFPSAGKDKTEDIAALYLGWGRNFLVLLDSDKGGRETASRLQRHFGAIVEGKILTLADVDTGWANQVLEDLFDPQDAQRISESVFPNESYLKSKFNTALQAAFIRKEEFQLSAATVKRFRQLLKHLAERIKRKD